MPCGRRPLRSGRRSRDCGSGTPRREPPRYASCSAPEPAAIAVQLDASDRELGTLELLRHEGEFDPAERQFASLAADLALLATQLCRDEARDGSSGSVLELAGDALAAASDERETGAHVARIAAMAAEADGALLWLLSPEGVVLDGAYARTPDLEAAMGAAETIMLDQQSTAVHELPEGSLVVLRLGQPPIGVLQLLYRTGGAPEQLAPVASFAVRAAHALRAAGRAHELAVELERSRALLAVVGEAIASLSLAHTLETAVEHVATLLDSDRVAVYLEEEGALTAAAARGLEQPHEQVARAVLELALGPRRGHGIVELADPAQLAQLGSASDEAAAAEITSVLALPLLVQEGLIGLLAVYPRRPVRLTPNESALLVALAAQLAVAVQNARLHERATSLGDELEAALAAERESAKRLRALYEISGTFAQSLSLADDARRPGSLDRDAARCRCCGDSDARRTRRRLRRSRRRGQRRARRRGGAGAALASAAAHPRGAAGAPGAAGAAAARCALGSDSRGCERPARALPREGLDGRDRSDRVRRGAARHPHDRLAPSRATGRRRDCRHGSLDHRAGRARNRQCPSLRPAEGVRGHDAAIPAAARGAGSRRARDRGRLRVGRARRRRRRRLRLPRAGGRAPRRRARRRHGPRRRGHCGHGDGEVRLSLARSGAHGSGRVPRCRERGRRLRGRRGQVHHDGRARPRHRGGNGRPVRAPGIPHRGSCSRTAASSRSMLAGLRSGSTRRRCTSRSRSTIRSAPASFSTPTASSRRDAAGSSSASSASTRCSPSNAAYLRGSSR